MKYFVILILILALTTFTSAQFKSQVDNQPSASKSLLRPSTSINSFFGLLNLNNLSMRHNFSFSYLSSGGQGLSLASYTNSMFYKISDPLNVRFDLTLQGSPFGQYGSAKQSDLSALYLSRAELNYRPFENFFFKIQYNSIPYNYLGMYPYHSYPYMLGDD